MTVYGFGTASVAIISCLSLLGIALFPTLKKRSHGYFIQFFIAFGAGALTSDVLLQMIPEVLGQRENDRITAWRMSVVCGGILIFFLFENSFKVWEKHRSKSQLPDTETRRENQDHNTITVTSFASTPNTRQDDFSDLEASVESTNSALKTESPAIEPHREGRKVFCGFTTVLLTIFVGDILHNIVDGMAIGVSFSSSVTDGIGASIAVLCHEVPHEFGDFIIHLRYGASKRQAVGLNAVSAIFAFIGLYGGILLSRDDAVRQWLLAIVAGIFLYIALVQVVVELAHHTTTSPILQFSLQIFGLLLGWTLMLLLALYEQAIEASINIS